MGGIGSILLLSDTEEIRIFAGAASQSSPPVLVFKLIRPLDIAGRSISPGEWTAANTYVHAWARSQDGAYACYTAIEREFPLSSSYTSSSLSVSHAGTATEE